MYSEAPIFGAEYFYYPSICRHEILIFGLVSKRAFRKYIIYTVTLFLPIISELFERCFQNPKFPNLANTPPPPPPPLTICSSILISHRNNKISVTEKVQDLCFMKFLEQINKTRTTNRTTS